MHPKTINGKRYCYKTIRTSPTSTTTRSLGKCYFNPIRCQKCKYYLKNHEITVKTPQKSRKKAKKPTFLRLFRLK